MPQCLRVYLENQKTVARIEDFKGRSLLNNEVQIKSQYSSVNYKDALAVTGKGQILKRFPLVPGIDVSGVIEKSTSLDFKEGDEVLVTGCGLGEQFDGGFSESVIVDKNYVIPAPHALDLKSAMVLGTAGFTAALCVHRMLVNGQKPQMGPIAVTGASGGVGGFAVQILSKLGFEVHAISSKKHLHEQLKLFGANKVISPDEFDLGHRPLEKSNIAGAIDNVGGEMLAGLSRQVGLWGNIACVGLAGGHEFNTTVMPMILRGVSLLGISSTNCPREIREDIWKMLATNWKPQHLNKMQTAILGLNEVLAYSNKMLKRQTHGRALVQY